MTDRKGILKKSPLVYTIASVRFTTWRLLSKKIDEIHDELRDILPIIQDIRIRHQVDQNAPEEKAWMLMPSDRSFGVQIAPNQMLLIHKKYLRYSSNFEEILGRVLDILAKHMRFIDVTNMGVRYIDHIKLRNNDHKSDYINEKFLPPDVDDFENRGGLVMGTYKTQNSVLRVQCNSQTGSLSVPHDIIPLLAMCQDAGQPLQFKALEKNEMILDIDSLINRQTPERMTNSQIKENLFKLHQEANTFFRHESVCTDHAFKVWKGEI